MQQYNMRSGINHTIMSCTCYSYYEKWHKPYHNVLHMLQLLCENVSEFLAKEIWVGVYIIMREICRPVLKMDLTALCIMESHSEFEPGCVVYPQRHKASGHWTGPNRRLAQLSWMRVGTWCVPWWKLQRANHVKLLSQGRGCFDSSFCKL